MGYKTLELTLISAKDLKNVNLIGKMDVYVVVYLSDDPKNEQKTPVHQDGGTNPSWNYTVRFAVDAATAAKPGKYLIFQLRHQSSFGGDKDLGEVLVSLKDLLDGVKGKSDPNPSQFLTYQVRTSSGKAKGELKLSYKFIDMGQGTSCSTSYAAAPPPAQPYPPPPVGYPGGGVYPPQPHQPPPPAQPYPPPPPAAVPYAAAAPQGYPPYGGYPPPPVGAGYGYGYPPPGGGYPPTGYPAQTVMPQRPKKNNKFGMGLGAGLIGGALGGLVLGEMVDDVYDSGYDAGFDSGFDDGGGFDF